MGAQLRNGLYFLHAHPSYARSWQNEEVQKIVSRRNARTVVGDMCAFGMTMEEDGEMSLVRQKDQVHDQCTKLS